MRVKPPCPWGEGPFTPLLRWWKGHDVCFPISLALPLLLVEWNPTEIDLLALYSPTLVNCFHLVYLMINFLQFSNWSVNYIKDFQRKWCLLLLELKGSLHIFCLLFLLVKTLSPMPSWFRLVIIPLNCGLQLMSNPYLFLTFFMGHPHALKFV